MVFRSIHGAALPSWHGMVHQVLDNPTSSFKQIDAAAASASIQFVGHHLEPRECSSHPANFNSLKPCDHVVAWAPIIERTSLRQLFHSDRSCWARATTPTTTICLACPVLLPLHITQRNLSANHVDLIASVDLDECIESLYKKNLLAESVIEAICAKTKELLMQESNVVHVQAPVTVVGDIHGQFYDLIEIFKIGGWCPDTNYLFLGMQSSMCQTDITGKGG
jgi:hypothetical protein